MTVSFVQQTEGVRPTSIGNQQVVQKDLSYLDSAASAIDTTLQGVDIVRTAKGEGIAKEAIAEAQGGVDKLQAESEEITELEDLGAKLTVDEVARKSALLKKGVARGKITREAAELMVSNEVSKAIQSNGLIASKVREAASGMLGFNPESRAVQQFFGAFEPAGTKTKISKFEQEVQQVAAATGKPAHEVRAKKARLIELREANEHADLELAAGLKETDQFIAEKVFTNAATTAEDFIGRVLDSGEDVNALDLKSLLQKDKIGTTNALLANITAKKGTITANTATTQRKCSRVK